MWRNNPDYAPVSRLLLAGSLLAITACSSLEIQPGSAEDVFSATPIPGGLYVDSSMRLGEISPFIFGTNYGPWSFVPLDLMPLAQQAGIKFIRFPGGDWGDENDLTELQIDNFINLARQIGAEPSISVRLEGGTPETAAELVRFINIEKGYAVKYWSIGNEPQYYAGYDTDRFNSEWRQFALAMEQIDPSIQLIGPEITQYLGNPDLDPRDNNGKLWVDEFLKSNGDLVDIVSIHRYPFPFSLSSGPASKEDLRSNLTEWDRIIPNLRDLVRDVTGRELPIAVTEFNSHWDAASGGEATPDSHFNAIWLADVLGLLIDQRVEVVAQFALQSQSDNGGWGLFSRFDPRPSYYVYQMYQHLGGQLVYSSSGIAGVSIYSALRKDGVPTVLIINLNSEPVEAPLQWHGGDSVQAEFWLFDEIHPAEQLESVELQNGSSIHLPAESISVLVFPG